MLWYLGISARIRPIKLTFRESFKDSDLAEISGKIVITPNASMSGMQMHCFLISMCVVSFGIAVGFAMAGLWLVLPFAGLEMLVLIFAFYAVKKSSACREVVSVIDENIIVETGRARLEKSCIFQRAWTQVLLQAPQIKGYPSRLLLRCGSRQVEVGACLSDDERQALRQRLIELKRLPQVFATAAG